MKFVILQLTAALFPRVQFWKHNCGICSRYFVDDFIVLMLNDVDRFCLFKKVSINMIPLRSVAHVNITYQMLKLMVRLDFEGITSKSEL